MILFFVDEAGDPQPHQEPLCQSDTPLFVLAAVAIDADRWRSLDRAVLGLKRRYFLPEMQTYADALPGRRPEHHEVKGHHLCKPSAASSRRNVNYIRNALGLMADHGARLFAAVWRKDALQPASPEAVYSHSLQVLSERFQYYCAARNDLGLVVADSRTTTLDFGVAAGHLSFLFGHNLGRTYTSLVEAPMFADSRLSAGLQLADIAGSALYGNYYARRCHEVPAYLANGVPATRKQVEGLGAAAEIRRPGRDYGHCLVHWQMLNNLQFRRTDVAPPTPGNVVPGYYGFRELN